MNLFCKFAVVLVSVFIAQTSLAADLPARTVSPVFDPQPLWSWTGVYVGAIAGPNILENGRVYFNGGLEAGYNYQYYNAVFGIETDLNFRPFHSEQYWVSVNRVGTVFDNHSTNNTTLLNTVRGRLGYALGRFLPYVTGGLAYGDIRLAQTDALAGAFAGEAWYGDHTWLRTGWTLGGGLEYALTDHISLKAEYLYYSFERVTLTRVLNVNPALTALGPTDRGLGQIARLGANYKF